MPESMAAPTPAALILWVLLMSTSMLPSSSAGSEYSLVVSGNSTLELSPSVIIENSPGSKPGIKLKCGRVQIHGLARTKHLDKFANSVKVKVSLVNLSGRPPNIEVCFHRNVSLEVGMCPQDQWERLSKGLWVKSMSPFDYKIIDIRTVTSYSGNLEVSLGEEFFMYRILFLFMGLVLMCLASWLSKSLVFYYSSAMLVGIFLVILMILFQGMKLLPTGRKSSLAIFVYSGFVGFGSFLLRYVPRLLRALLVEIGLSEDMYNPLAIFGLVFLVITGAWMGFWVVRKVVVTVDGSVDTAVSRFVTVSIWIVASVMILQSSLDPLLAVEACLGGIIVSKVLRQFAHSKYVRRVYKKLRKPKKINLIEPLDPYASPATISASKPFTRSPYNPVQGSTTTSKSPTRLSDSQTFYSSFHDTPDQRKYTKDEWESFTKESTRKALEGLVSSPDFSKWAVTNADRLTLAPNKEIADKQKRWFHWF